MLHSRCKPNRLGDLFEKHAILLNLSLQGDSDNIKYFDKRGNLTIVVTAALVVGVFQKLCGYSRNKTHFAVI